MSGFYFVLFFFYLARRCGKTLAEVAAVYYVYFTCTVDRRDVTNTRGAPGTKRFGLDSVFQSELAEKETIVFDIIITRLIMRITYARRTHA